MIRVLRSVFAWLHVRAFASFLSAEDEGQRERAFQAMRVTSRWIEHCDDRLGVYSSPRPNEPEPPAPKVNAKGSSVWS